MNGGIISAALGLIKEKERQGDKAMDRLHDGMKTQMNLTANQGSWTGESKSPGVVKEKVVEKEKVKEPEEEKPEEKSKTTIPATPTEDKPEGKSETAIPATPTKDKEEDDIANMGIIRLAQSASK